MKNLLINLFIIFTALFSFIITLFDKAPLGYELLWIQPLAYTFIYTTIYMKLIQSKKYSITVYLTVILSWLRLVLIPFISVISGMYNGISYIDVSIESIKIANFLIVYEFIVISIFLFGLIHLKTNYKFGNYNLVKNIKLNGNKSIYAVFILFSIILYITIGRKMNIIEFFVISLNTQERFSDITSTSLVFLRQIFKVSMIFTFVWLSSYFQKKFNYTKKKKYVFYTIIIAILNVGIIVGERRSEQVYTLLVMVFILTKIYERYRKRIIISLSLVTVFILLFMSIYKHFSAFYYGSYLGAISTSNSDIRWLSQTLHLYFFSTQNVAVAIDFSKNDGLSLLNMLYDFGRSFFGLSFLLKNRMIMTTEYFNTYIYGFTKAGGHVISGLGYGYIYFGALLSPIIVCLNIFISIKLEKIFNRAKSFEGKYIFGYMLVRFTTNIFVNTPPLISLSTIMLFTAGLLYLVAKYFKPNKNMESKMIENVT